MSTPAESDRPEEIATLRIELSKSDPLVWRQLEVPTAITLATLHDIVQAAMGWDDSHLWAFVIDRQSFSVPDEMFEVNDAGAVQLHEVMRPRRTRFRYIYDFGDSWDHSLTVARPRPGRPGVSYPRLLGGERAAPPEDCGGMWGFSELLAALADPGDPEYAELAERFADWQADDIQAERIEQHLARIAAWFHRPKPQRRSRRKTPHPPEAGGEP